MNVREIFNRHPRSNLSAYVDGELPSSAVARIDAHLVACEACASEVVSVRVLRTAVAELPEVSAPRSFALTPAQVAAPGSEPYRGYQQPPAVLGMRLASVGLAAALAFVVVVDAGNIGEEGGGDDTSRSMLEFAAGADESATDLSSSSVQDALGWVAGDDSAPPEGEATKAEEDGGAGVAEATGAPDAAEGYLPATGAGSGDPDAPAATGEATPDAVAAPAPSLDGNEDLPRSAEDQYGLTVGDDDAEAGDTAGDIALTSAESADDGSQGSTLLVVEIALAAALGAALIASLVLARSRNF